MKSRRAASNSASRVVSDRTADPNGVLLDIIKPIPSSPEFQAQYTETALP